MSQNNVFDVDTFQFLPNWLDEVSFIEKGDRYGVSVRFLGSEIYGWGRTRDEAVRYLKEDIVTISYDACPPT